MDKFVDFTFHKEKIDTHKTISSSDLDLVPMRLKFSAWVFSFKSTLDTIREGDGTRVL